MTKKETISPALIASKVTFALWNSMLFVSFYALSAGVLFVTSWDMEYSNIPEFMGKIHIGFILLLDVFLIFYLTRRNTTAILVLPVFLAIIVLSIFNLIAGICSSIIASLLYHFRTYILPPKKDEKSQKNFSGLSFLLLFIVPPFIYVISSYFQMEQQDIIALTILSVITVLTFLLQHIALENADKKFLVFLLITIPLLLSIYGLILTIFMTTAIFLSLFFYWLAKIIKKNI